MSLSCLVFSSCVMTSSQQDEKLTMELTTEAGHTTTNTAPTRVDRNAVIENAHKVVRESGYKL